MLSGWIQSDLTWPQNSPSFLLVIGGNDLSVPDGVTLTLNETIVKAGHDTELKVYGTLDTNGDSSATSPAAGDWKGIYLYGKDAHDGIGYFDYCRIRYGGNTSGDADANVCFDQYSEGYFANSVSEHSDQHGIKISGSSPIITGSMIIANSSYGIYNSTNSILISAENNWWGDPSGPLDSSDDTATGGLYNPNGLGDKVSDYVDYDPWVNSGPTEPIPEVTTVILILIALMSILGLVYLKRRSSCIRWAKL